MKREQLPLERLLATIEKLRSPEGCPWDRKQTPVSLQKYLQEEVQELLEAIDAEDTENICEEIGDVLYVLLMFSVIYSENQQFTIADCISAIDEKLRRRHPHVFDGKKVMDDDQLKLQWERIKREEKKRNI